MKLKRISKSELKMMKTLVIIWQPKSYTTAKGRWCIDEFEVESYSNGHVNLFTIGSNFMTAGSFEEAMLKAQVVYPCKQVFKISTSKQDFCPPCGYDICGKDVSVHEIKL